MTDPRSFYRQAFLSTSFRPAAYSPSGQLIGVSGNTQVPLGYTSQRARPGLQNLEQFRSHTGTPVRSSYGQPQKIFYRNSRHMNIIRR